MARGKAASTYEINDQVVKLSEVQTLVGETYNIAIDNLCTFLPQDRVGSFSGFDAQMLLKETEKSVSGSGHLYRQHEQLIQLESEMLNSDSNLITAKAELERLEGEVNRLEREKELMEEREESVKQLDLYEKKHVWVLFDGSRLAAVELKKRKKDVERQLKAAQEGMAPLMEEIGRLEHEYGRGKQERIALQREIDRKRNVYNTSFAKVDKIHDGLDEATNKLATIDSEKRSAEHRVRVCQDDVDGRKAVLSDYPPLEEIQEKVKEAQNEVREAKRGMMNARREVQTKQR